MSDSNTHRTTLEDLMRERGLDMDDISIAKGLGYLLNAATQKVIAFVEGHPELSRGPGDDPDGWAAKMATLTQLCKTVSAASSHAATTIAALRGDSLEDHEREKGTAAKAVGVSSKTKAEETRCALHLITLTSRPA